MKPKESRQKAIRTTISVHPPLWEMGQEIMKLERYGDFSGMIQELIRERARALNIVKRPHDSVAA